MRVVVRMSQCLGVFGSPCCCVAPMKACSWTTSSCSSSVWGSLTTTTTSTSTTTSPASSAWRTCSVRKRWTIKPSTTSAVTYYIKWSKYRRRSHPRVTVQPSLPPRVSMESQVTFCKMQQATNHKIDNQMFVFSSTGVIQVLIWVSRSPEITRWNLYWSSWAKSVVWGEC